MRSDPLELATRRRIHRVVMERPGLHLRELQRLLDMGMGALEYHLATLVRADLVAVLHGGQKRYFPIDMPPEDRRVLSFLRQDLPRRVLVVLMDQGPATRGALVGRLDVAPSTLAHHLRALTGHGLVEPGKARRETVYAIVDPDRVLRLLVLHRSTLVDRMLDRFLDGVDALR